MALTQSLIDGLQSCASAGKIWNRASWGGTIPVPGGVVMRVELSDAGNYPPVREYFLRLGASVTSSDGLTIDVDFPEGLLDEDESPEMYLKTWARANHLHARVIESSPSAAEANGCTKARGPAIRPGRPAAATAWGIARTEGVHHGGATLGGPR